MSRADGERKRKGTVAVTIRKARRADLPGMHAIDQFGAQLEGYDGLDLLDPEHKEAKGEGSYFKRFLYGKDRWCLVAEMDSKIAGFILFNIEKRAVYFKFNRVGYLDLVIVDKAARGRGIARLLVQEATKILAAAGMTHLKLSVHTQNPAHEVWKALGFSDYRIDMWKRI